MIKILKMTDYALSITLFIIKNNKPYSAVEISNDLNLPLPAVSKILKILTKNNILTSQRGREGGYYVDRKPDLISIGEIIEAFEGPISITECSSDLKNNECRVLNHCLTSKGLIKINNVIKDALFKIKLDTLLEEGKP